MPLFHQLLASASGGRARPRVHALPVSVGLHACAAAALVASSILTPDVLPEPRGPVDWRLVVAPQPLPPTAPAIAAVRHRAPSVKRPTIAAAPVAPMLQREAQHEPDEATHDPDHVDIQAGGLVWPCEDCVAGGDPRARLGSQTEPADASEPKPVRVGHGVEAPRKLRHVAPVYPELAKQARVQGTVTLECRIDPQGHVAQARVLSGSTLLDGAALEAVRQWVYTPTRLNGVPVPVVLTVTVRFELR